MFELHEVHEPRWSKYPIIVIRCKTSIGFLHVGQNDLGNNKFISFFLFSGFNLDIVAAAKLPIDKKIIDTRRISIKFK